MVIFFVVILISLLPLLLLMIIKITTAYILLAYDFYLNILCFRMYGYFIVRRMYVNFCIILYYLGIGVKSTVK